MQPLVAGIYASKRQRQLQQLMTPVCLWQDLGYADLGYSSSDSAARGSTPTIDELAQSGIKLGTLYTWNWCAPSRGQLLTGVYAPRNGYALDASGGALLWLSGYANGAGVRNV
eukprot:COSAG05_NODE_634_length_8193_cov_7.035083_6_plen_113_part_00